MINMIKFKKLKIIPKEGTMQTKRDIQFMFCDVYIKKSEIIGITMTSKEPTILDTWKDDMSRDFLKQNNIDLCTIICKRIDGLSNIVVDENVLQLIKE